MVFSSKPVLDRDGDCLKRINIHVREISDLRPILHDLFLGFLKHVIGDPAVFLSGNAAGLVKPPPLLLGQRIVELARGKEKPGCIVMMGLAYVSAVLCLVVFF